MRCRGPRANKPGLSPKGPIHEASRRLRGSSGSLCRWASISAARKWSKQSPASVSPRLGEAFLAFPRPVYTKNRRFEKGLAPRAVVSPANAGRSVAGASSGADSAARLAAPGTSRAALAARPVRIASDPPLGRRETLAVARGGPGAAPLPDPSPHFPFDVERFEFSGHGTDEVEPPSSRDVSWWSFGRHCPWSRRGRRSGRRLVRASGRGQAACSLWWNCLLNPLTPPPRCTWRASTDSGSAHRVASIG